MEQPKIKKGTLGHIFDIREAVGRVSVAASMWCKAFDLGDMDAVVQHSVIFSEAVTDLSEISAIVEDETAKQKGES